MQQLQKSFGFGVDEDTGLYIHNGVASVVGNSGVWILDSSSAEYLEEYYFSIEGVKIHYLTSGDSFNLETKELTTFKPAIVPENVEMYESEDIFGFNEGLKSIQDLVNSPIFTTNIGHSYEEDPIARVVFRKELDTQAYVSGDKYAIASLLMDINTYRNQNNTKNKSKKLK
jgi:cyanophycinase